jgi:hypothetical protein
MMTRPMSIAAVAGLDKHAVPGRAEHTIAEVSMASVLVHTMMSLDGFIAGPNHEMDWVFEHAGEVPAPLIEEVIATTGAILGGRRGYEVGRSARRPETSKPFGGRRSGPVFILTHRPLTTRPTRLTGSCPATSARRRPPPWLPQAAGTCWCSARTWPASAGAKGSSLRSSSTSCRQSWGTACACSANPVQRPASTRLPSQPPARW